MGPLVSDKDWQTARKVELLKREDGQKRLAATKPEPLADNLKPRTRDNGPGNWRN